MVPSKPNDAELQTIKSNLKKKKNEEPKINQG